VCDVCSKEIILLVKPCGLIVVFRGAVHSQDDVRSFVVSADASVVFFVSNKTQLIKWLVNDSHIAATTDMSAALAAMTDEGRRLTMQYNWSQSSPPLVHCFLYFSRLNRHRLSGRK